MLRGGSRWADSCFGNAPKIASGETGSNRLSSSEAISANRDRPRIKSEAISKHIHLLFAFRPSLGIVHCKRKTKKTNTNVRPPGSGSRPEPPKNAAPPGPHGEGDGPRVALSAAGLVETVVSANVPASWAKSAAAALHAKLWKPFETKWPATKYH